ncbi:hypothetical protein ElyMa_005485300 [Elysia marginata]|uniref:Uncharacterized protein n=1 Tax=Elysia marginata TaxID=1093978 RepID=A0AAV4ETL6_9GAST|nr:hypothetical protein ElyMa_005485300 [Elysia marginata]
MRRCPRRSTNRLDCRKKSAPRSGCRMSATIRRAVYILPLKHNETFLDPSVAMVVPLAACSGWSFGPDRLSNREAGTAETWAPVSTRKRRPEWESVRNNCWLRGPAADDITVGPPWRFPAS